MPSDDAQPDLEVNVLLVDDRPANLLALEAILDGLGANLVQARSGEEALGRLAGDDFAVILLDLRMPGLDGFETARLVRGRERTRHTPIIFLTAQDASRPTVEQAYALGAVDFLVKPLVPVVLRAKVAGFIDLFQKTEQIKRQAEHLRRLERGEFERKLAEENARLRVSEERFARFMQHLPGLAWIKDVQGRYLYANDAAVRAFRTPRAELYGKTDDQVFPPETAAQFRENDRRALAGGAGVQVVETLEHEDGVLHHALVSKFPIPGPDGQAALVGGMAIDVTQRIAMEAALKEADRRKDEFLAMLAHELRNPLAPIRNAVHILKLLGPADPNLRRAGDMIERQVQHLARLVDDLLDVSRITRSKIKLQKEKLDLAAVVARAVEESQSLIDARGHRLTVTLPPQPVWLEGDATRLAQVLANLLNNAAKYTEEGRDIGLAVEHGQGEAVVRVRDTGQGIPADLLPRVFDLFTQGDRSLARSEGGLGIGLTVVRSLVEMHGGSVEAHSEGAGQGSEFVVRLPALEVKSASAEDDGGAQRAAPPSPSRRVLVVDDNHDAAESLAMLLKAGGHEVRTAHDGPAALDEAASFRPEVVLLDIGLPRMDGYEVARRLREEVGLQGALLVAVTGYGQEEDRRRAEEAGFQVHLVKPADPGAVQALLARHGAPAR